MPNQITITDQALNIRLRDLLIDISRAKQTILTATGMAKGMEVLFWSEIRKFYPECAQGNWTSGIDESERVVITRQD